MAMMPSSRMASGTTSSATGSRPSNSARCSACLMECRMTCLPGDLVSQANESLRLFLRHLEQRVDHGRLDREHAVRRGNTNDENLGHVVRSVFALDALHFV